MDPSLQPYPWYAVVSGSEIQQGDILENCPIFSPPEQISGASEPEVVRTSRNIIVMTQSCDMQRDNPPEEVLLCGIYRQHEIPKDHKLAKIDSLNNVRKGNMPAFHLLAKCEISGFERDLTIVDFRRVYSLPFKFVQSEAERCPRLRLLPPYREHLSQAFARLFMRVGLPIDIAPLR